MKAQQEGGGLNTYRPHNTLQYSIILGPATHCILIGPTTLEYTEHTYGPHNTLASSQDYMRAQQEVASPQHTYGAPQHLITEHTYGFRNTLTSQGYMKA
jgi:hypothetical protein